MRTRLSRLSQGVRPGVNYIDTYNYHNGQGEYVVGKALKGYEDKVYLSTKLPTWMVEKTEDYRRLLEEQLKRWIVII